MFQGPKEIRLKNWEDFPVSPGQIDEVFLTHAHIDHVGYLPRFCRQNFKGTIRCTHPTQELCAITLRDSAHLQEEDAYWANKQGYTKHKPAQPLYTIKDAEATARFFEPVHYGEQYAMSPEIRVKFKDSAYSGVVVYRYQVDPQRTCRRFVHRRRGRPALLLQDPVQVYARLSGHRITHDRLHETVPADEALAGDQQRPPGAAAIPSPAIGRTQTLLYVIRELEEKAFRCRSPSIRR
jgi:metallo-beta-lactamase family protein